MPRTLKLGLWVTVSVLAAPFVAFGIYDLVVFQPRMAEIRRFIAEATPEEKAPPHSLRKVILVAYPDRLDARVARLLLDELNAMPKGARMLRWHLTGALWWALVGLHLSEAEQMTLFLALSPMGNAKGFAKVSPGLVGVPLSAVSVDQAARLVTVGKAPSIYLHNAERLRLNSEALAQRAKNAL